MILKFRVDDVFEIKKSEKKWQELGQKYSRFLFIGKNLDFEEIQKILKS